MLESTTTTKVQKILQLPEWHSKEQALMMNFYRMDPECRELWAACGTKFGKSLAISTANAQALWVHRMWKMRWIAPIYQQAKIGLDYTKKILPGEPYVTPNLKDLSLYVRNQQNLIEFKSGQNPEDLEGEAINANALDEASKMKPQVYDSAIGTMTMTYGKLAGFSTPRGKNWFYKKCMNAKDEMIWCLKRKRIPTKLFIHAPTRANPNVRIEAIEAARKNLGPRLFSQYYEAEFVDDGAIFVNFRSCIYGEEIEVSGSVQFWKVSNSNQVDVVIGADWAKHTDFTVFTAWGKIGGKHKVVGFLRFQSIGYIEAVRELRKFSRCFKSVDIVYHDRTGIGDAVDDILSHTDLNYEGIIFSNTSKSAMVNNLMMGFETEQCSIPNWEEMLKELDSFEVVTSVIGTMRYSAPSGLHDDIVCSMMLGYAASTEFNQEFRVMYLDELTGQPIHTSWLDKLTDDIDN